MRAYIRLACVLTALAAGATNCLKKGVGLGCIHYAVEIPKDKGGAEFLQWIGGYYETGYSINPHWGADLKINETHPILRGVKKPQDCKLFGTVCTPENPVGSCMVSSEGACAAYYAYGRFRDREAA